MSTDTADDAVIDILLENASRFLDGATSRKFYPTVENQYFDIPNDNELLFDDLLEVITFTNGDGVAIASTEYNLEPKNLSPRYGLKLKGSSSVSWQPDSSGNSEDVLSLLGLYGYHNSYTLNGWKSAGTLGAAIADTTTLAFTMSAGHSVAVGKTYRIDNELFNIATVATNTITPLARGDNGSTAATHLINAVVYEWQPMTDAKNSVLEIASQEYRRRFGESGNSSSTFVAGGVIISSKDIPTLAQQFINTYLRIV